MSQSGLTTLDTHQEAFDVQDANAGTSQRLDSTQVMDKEQARTLMSPRSDWVLLLLLITLARTRAPGPPPLRRARVCILHVERLLQRLSA